MTLAKTILAIIVDYKSAQDAIQLSLQIAQLTQNKFKIQVVHVENGKTALAQLTPEQKKYGIAYLFTEENLGYAGAINFAIQSYLNKNQKFDYYWFLNPDLEIEHQCLEHLVDTLLDQPQVGAVGPVVKFASFRNRVWGARGVVSPQLGITAMTDWQSGGLLPKWSYLPGCSLLTRSEAYFEVGKLPEHYKLYYEETEFCIRLQRMGWDLWVNQNAIVYHKVDSMKDKIPARHFAYYFARNNLYFWKTCFGIPIWFQLPRTLFVIFKEILLPLRRAKTYQEFKDRIKYTWAGFIDGVRFAQGKLPRFENKLFP